MRRLLLLILLATSVSGCCCACDGPCPPMSRLSLSEQACAASREAYAPGYRRPCYPAYRPFESAFSP
jgi:hypothetical protein